MTTDAPAPRVILTTRNCFRCGEEFRAFEQHRICPTCRRPKRSRGCPPRAELLGKPLGLRERQVCDLVVQGLQNKEIAGKLHLETSSVKQYLVRIFGKLGLTSRTALAVWTLGNRA